MSYGSSSYRCRYSALGALVASRVEGIRRTCWGRGCCFFSGAYIFLSVTKSTIKCSSRPLDSEWLWSLARLSDCCRRSPIAVDQLPAVGREGLRIFIPVESTSVLSTVNRASFPSNDPMTTRTLLSLLLSLADVRFQKP